MITFENRRPHSRRHILVSKGASITVNGIADHGKFKVSLPTLWTLGGSLNGHFCGKHEMRSSL